MKLKINEIFGVMESIEYGFKDELGNNIINVDIEKLAMDNLKLTNLPKLTKNTERTNEQVITEETINTI